MRDVAVTQLLAILALLLLFSMAFSFTCAVPQPLLRLFEVVVPSNLLLEEVVLGVIGAASFVYFVLELAGEVFFFLKNFA